MKTVTRSLAEFVVTTDAASLPDWSLHEAKRTLLNMLAISLSASRSKGAAIMLEWARDEAAAEHASVIGAKLKTSTSVAALLNGFLAHLQDYDDTHFPTILHPTAPVWPAVLATAERGGTSGRDALAAFVLGAETACRVAISVHPWHYDQGWHITGTAGVFGAAAGAGKVIGLDADRLTNAFGAAGTLAAGVREVFGTHGKPFMRAMRRKAACARRPGPGRGSRAATTSSAAGAASGPCSRPAGMPSMRCSAASANAGSWR